MIIIKQYDVRRYTVNVCRAWHRKRRIIVWELLIAKNDSQIVIFTCRAFLDTRSTSSLYTKRLVVMLEQVYWSEQRGGQKGDLDICCCKLRCLEMSFTSLKGK